jgi:lysozyme
MRSIAIVLLACLLASCGGHRSAEPEVGRSFAGPPRFGDADPHEWGGVGPWQYPVHGIDVSKYQGDIDWHRVRASGIDFAFIKATEGGDHADDRFQQNWEAARAAGMPRGAYHYYYVCRPAAEQVAWFINHVPREPGALPPVVDLEWNHKSRTCPFRPDPATIRREALLFLQALNVYYRKRPVIYTTVDFYRDNDLGRLEGFHFWLRSVAGHPEEVYPDQRWAFWQYTGTGLVEGIDGLTDINVFGGTRAQWSAFASG